MESEGMDSILVALESNVEKLYKEKKFHEVEEMFSTFLKESQEESSSIRARYWKREYQSFLKILFFTSEIASLWKLPMFSEL